MRCLIGLAPGIVWNLNGHCSSGQQQKNPVHQWKVQTQHVLGGFEHFLLAEDERFQEEARDESGQRPARLHGGE